MKHPLTRSLRARHRWRWRSGGKWPQRQPQRQAAGRPANMRRRLLAITALGRHVDRWQLASLAGRDRFLLIKFGCGHTATIYAGNRWAHKPAGPCPACRRDPEGRREGFAAWRAQQTGQLNRKPTP